MGDLISHPSHTYFQYFVNRLHDLIYIKGEHNIVEDALSRLDKIEDNVPATSPEAYYSLV